VLMAQVEQELRNEVARKVREAELGARDESERRAREIVTESIQRIAADQTAEVSVSVAAAADRRAQGPNHRQGGPQHPRPSAGNWDRPDCGRHTRKP